MELNYVNTETPVSLTYCPVCGDRGDELVIGEVYKYTNENDELLGYGHPGGVLAQALIGDGVEYVAVPLEDNEPAPGGHACDNCSAEIRMQQKRFEAEVIAGGLHWSCTMCNKFGVIVKDDSRGFCSATRGAAGVQPPNQLGVRFDHCDQHASEEDPTTGVQ